MHNEKSKDKEESRKNLSKSEKEILETLSDGGVYLTQDLRDKTKMKAQLLAYHLHMKKESLVNRGLVRIVSSVSIEMRTPIPSRSSGLSGKVINRRVFRNYIITDRGLRAISEE